jgi:hypothetical protein
MKYRAKPLVVALCIAIVAVVDAIGWTLIYVARALVFVRIRWNTAWIESRFNRFIETRHASYSVFDKPLGRVVIATFAWCLPVAVILTRTANRLLPPLRPDEGFLTRLYEPMHRRMASELDRRSGTR